MLEGHDLVGAGLGRRVVRGEDHAGASLGERTDLAELKPAGFPAQLLSGIDRGLALRAADRPQTIEQWRSALYSAAAPPPAATSGC